jgi:hypothetical protein
MVAGSDEGPLPLSGAVCPFAKRVCRPVMNEGAYRYDAAGHKGHEDAKPDQRPCHWPSSATPRLAQPSAPEGSTCASCAKASDLSPYPLFRCAEVPLEARPSAGCCPRRCPVFPRVALRLWNHRAIIVYVSCLRSKSRKNSGTN